MGEIGGNDYNYAFLKRLQPLQVMALVPPVVAEVERQLDRLLLEQPRVKKMIILGQFPLGCISLYLGQASSNTNTNMSSPLDTHGCIAPISAVTDLHDKLLKISVAKLRRKRCRVEILFFDLAPHISMCWTTPRGSGSQTPLGHATYRRHSCSCYRA